MSFIGLFKFEKLIVYSSSPEDLISALLKLIRTMKNLKKKSNNVKLQSLYLKFFEVGL